MVRWSAAEAEADVRIEDYDLVGDLQTGPLLGRDGFGEGLM